MIRFECFEKANTMSQKRGLTESVAWRAIDPLEDRQTQCVVTKGLEVFFECHFHTVQGRTPTKIQNEDRYI